MQNKWIKGVVLGVALIVCPAVEGAERISARLLQEAKAKVVEIESLISAAQEGDADSQFALGLMIEHEGRKLAVRDIERKPYPDAASIKTATEEIEASSMEWFLRAAKQGHGAAQWAVAGRYEDVDIVQAYAWYLVQVRQGGESSSTRGGITKSTGEWMLEKMSSFQVVEAERLSRKLEREIEQAQAKD